MVSRPLQSQLPTIILILLTCPMPHITRFWEIFLQKPFIRAKQTNIQKTHGCGVTGFKKPASCERLREEKNVLKKIHPQNNDSKEREASSKRGIRAAANTQGVCICHCTFESIRVKFRLKRN